MSTVLNVTGRDDFQRNSLWTAYVVLNGFAVIVARADCLDDLRYYADREGYDGILLGATELPQARLQRLEAA